MNVSSILVTSVLVALSFFPYLIHGETLSDNTFTQTIDVPIDTALPESKFQPIDIKVEFDHPCWAKDEINRSIRVFCEGSFGVEELESQIYDLEFIDKEHISSCRLVFLIPEFADGTEKYYISYSDREVPIPNYPDHVSVIDSHYYYEPIPGQKIDFDYYRITEDGYVIYGVVQKGILLGTYVGHTIIKLKPNSTEFETVNADQFASFAFSYGAKDGETGTQEAKTVDKSVLVDGNLMVRMRIRSKSPEGDVETDNVYTYYYSPTPVKRICVKVNHRVLKTIEVRYNIDRDGSYATLSTFKSRSSSIDKMNVGDILPFLSFYSDDGVRETVDIPKNPSTKETDWIISTDDDKDIGKNAWVCMHEDEPGKLHALVFDSVEGISNERDGLQVKMGVKENVKLPGLEADSCSVYVTRDSYDSGTEHDTVIEEGMNISFDAEFVTFEKGTLDDIDRESMIFRSLAEYRSITKESGEEGVAVKRYNLTVFTLFAHSFPFGSLLSAATGKNFSYIYVEIYRDNSLASSGTASKIPIHMDTSSSEDNKSNNFVEKIKSSIAVFDWKNISFFRKLKVPNLEKGNYLIKVYRENSLFGGRRFIGFKFVNLSSDKKVYVVCSPQITLKVSLKDQYDNYVSGADLILKYEGKVLQSISTTQDTVKIPFPYKRGDFTLEILYKGFLVCSERFRLGLLDITRGISIEKKIKLYSLTIRVKDAMGLDFGPRLYPSLTSKEMFEKKVLSPDEESKVYVFRNLYPSNYTLKLAYRNYTTERNVFLNSDKNLEIDFPVTHRVEIRVKDYSAFDTHDVKAIFTRESKEVSTYSRNGVITATIPPGSYIATFLHENKLIARFPLNVYGEVKQVVISSEESPTHSFLYYSGMILFIIALLLFMFWKRQIRLFLSTSVISMLLLSLSLPWWLLSGESVKTVTKITIFPPAITSFISTTSTYGGEINTVPPIIIQIFTITLYLIILSMLAVILSNLFKSGRKRMILLVISLIPLIISTILFSYSVSQLTSAGVGGFYGRGKVDVSVLNEQMENVICSWGPYHGFFATIFASILIVFICLMEGMERRHNR
ncbi:MAG: hypothetical protein J7K38_00900 [Thermoplasmata archaeon]|nr:hypothetical protein [Thermoplasmata archaeon]